MAASRDQLGQLLASSDPFIRRRLGYGAFVGARYPYLYMETPKSACTTTKSLLWRLEGLGPIPYESRPHERPADDPRLSLLNIPTERALDVLTSPNVFRFCVWRDPVRRLASCYWEKIHEKADPGAEWVQWRALIVRSFNLASEDDITLDIFVQFVCRVRDDQRDPHFMSQWRLNLADLIAYDRVVRLDRFADDMAEVYRRIGAPEAAFADLGRHDNRSGSERVAVPEATAAMIREAFAQDFELLKLGQPAA